MGKIVKCKTEHVAQMKTLIEVLSGILDSTNITFGRASDTSTETNTEKSDKKKKKTKAKSTNEHTDKKDPPFSGMRILAISPDNTVLICLKLYANKFMEYVCKPEEYNICLSLPQLYKLIKTTDKATEMELSIDSDYEHVLVMTMNNTSVMRKTENEIKLMETIPSALTPPNIEADVRITMEAQEFHRLCKNMASIGQVLEIKCTTSTLVFSCNGEVSSSKTTYTTSEDGIKIMYTHPNKQSIFQGMYELRHLNLFAKCTSLSTYVQLLMKLEKYPLCIQYTVAILGDFIAVISPIEQESQSFNDDAYANEQNVHLKDEYNETVNDD